MSGARTSRWCGIALGRQPNPTIGEGPLTRIAACLRAGTHYLLRDTDGRVITEAQGRAIVAERYTVPPEVRAARRKVTPHRHPRRNERNERAKTGVATRSKASPVPQPA